MCQNAVMYRTWRGRLLPAGCDGLIWKGCCGYEHSAMGVGGECCTTIEAASAC